MTKVSLELVECGLKGEGIRLVVEAGSFFFPPLFFESMAELGLTGDPFRISRFEVNESEPICHRRFLPPFSQSLPKKATPSVGASLPQKNPLLT